MSSPRVEPAGGGYIRVPTQNSNLCLVLMVDTEKPKNQKPKKNRLCFQ